MEYFIIFILVGIVIYQAMQSSDKSAQINALQRENRSMAETQSVLEKGLDQANQKSQELEVKNEVWRANTEKLANHFANDSLKNIASSVTPNNYESSRKKLDRVFDILRKHNCSFPTEDEQPFRQKLKAAFEDEVRRDEARQEQIRIKEKIREEQRAERVRADEIKRLESEQAAIEMALTKALKKVSDEHSEEVLKLKAMLAEAQAKSERAKSQAQLTKAGYVYVISNIGSFGEGIYKVGMTRRLIPDERIKELGDASVPFSFDVHMMISCDDAPALENSLHSHLHKCRVNKVNWRKEFFRTDLESIRKAVEKSHGKVEYSATPEAFEYRETLIIEERGFDQKFDSNRDGSLDDASDEVA